MAGTIVPLPRSMHKAHACTGASAHRYGDSDRLGLRGKHPRHAPSLHSHWPTRSGWRVMRGSRQGPHSALALAPEPPGAAASRSNQRLPLSVSNSLAAVHRDGPGSEARKQCVRGQLARGVGS